MKIRIKYNVVPLIKIVIVLSVVSQIQLLNGYLRPLMYFGWVALAMAGIIYQHGSINLSKPTRVFIVCYIGLVLLCAVFEFVTGKGYFSGVYFRTLLIPLAIVITIDTNAALIDEDSFISIVKYYIVASVIYAIYVNATYFPSLNSWLNQIQYLFEDKNSAAQIWSTATVLAIMIAHKGKGKWQWFWRIVAIYLLCIVILSQCRTAVLGLAIGYLFYVLFYSKRKLVHLAFVVTILFAALNIPQINAYFYKALFITRSHSLNMNTFSSGRITIYKEAIEVIRDHFWNGIGNYYVDCSYLMILCETGILGFILIETIWMTRIVSNMKIKTDNSLERTVSVVTVYFIVSSVLEGLPPFGPGVATFMFWIISECSIFKIIDNKRSLNMT